MLRSRSLFALATLTLVVGTNACVVSWGDQPLDDDSSFFDDDGSSVSAGAGGNASSTGVGGDTSTGVGGGDPYCIDGEGTGQTAEMCEDLAISPDNFGVCGDGLTALGYAACSRSFEIWEGGFAEALAECLSYIPAENACDEQPVLDCLDEVYIETCEVPYIEQTCASWADTCSETGETLDEALCYGELTPFSDDGLDELTDCMNEIDDTCQVRYDTCFVEVTAVD